MENYPKIRNTDEFGRYVSTLIVTHVYRDAVMELLKKQNSRSLGLALLHGNEPGHLFVQVVEDHV